MRSGQIICSSTIFLYDSAHLIKQKKKKKKKKKKKRKELLHKSIMAIHRFDVDKIGVERKSLIFTTRNYRTTGTVTQVIDIPIQIGFD